MVRPLRMAAVLLCAPPAQCLLRLHPTHMTNIPEHLSQVQASDPPIEWVGEGQLSQLVSW